MSWKGCGSGVASRHVAALLVLAFGTRVGSPHDMITTYDSSSSKLLCVSLT